MVPNANQRVEAARAESLAVGYICEYVPRASCAVFVTPFFPFSVEGERDVRKNTSEWGTSYRVVHVPAYRN